MPTDSIFRENALHQYQWRLKRKAELEEEQCKRKLEAERAEKERQKSKRIWVFSRPSVHDFQRSRRQH